MATESKHTPVPWATEHMTGDCWLIYDAEGEGIARTCEPGVDGARNYSDEENEANARLIVRACNAHKELLKALLQLVDLASEISSSNQHDIHIPGIVWIGFREAISQARAAIAKAREGQGVQP